MRLFNLPLALICLSALPAANLNKYYLPQKSELSWSYTQSPDSVRFSDIPDSVSYLADFSLMSESMSLLMGDEQHSATVSKKSAPFFLYPSPESGRIWTNSNRSWRSLWN